MATEFPGDRPGTYNPDLTWDETTALWSADEELIKQATGRYRTQIVTACSNKIYYEPIE